MVPVSSIFVLVIRLTKQHFLAGDFKTDIILMVEIQTCSDTLQKNNYVKFLDYIRIDYFRVPAQNSVLKTLQVPCTDDSTALAIIYLFLK